MKNFKGSTLVECIASIALFSLAVTILTGGFLTAANLAVRSGEIRTAGDRMINTLYTSEANSGITYDKGAVQDFSFTFSGVNAAVKGKYISAYDSEYELTAFSPEKSMGNFIPETGIPVNGSWPDYDDFPNQWNYITIPEGTTFIYSGKFYIAGSNLNVGPRGCTPYDNHLRWLFSNNNLVEITTDKPPIVWDGKTNLHTVINNLGYPTITKGDKLLWNGEYYVYLITDQSWPGTPISQPSAWQKIVYPFS